MQTATLTREPEVTILDERDDCTTLVIDGAGYFVRAVQGGYLFEKEDPRRLNGQIACSYMVWVRAGRAVRCGCNDCHYRHTRCKHQVAAQQLLARW